MRTLTKPRTQRLRSLVRLVSWKARSKVSLIYATVVALALTPAIGLPASSVHAEQVFATAAQSRIPVVDTVLTIEYVWTDDPSDSNSNADFTGHVTFGGKHSQKGPILEANEISPHWIFSQRLTEWDFKRASLEINLKIDDHNPGRDYTYDLTPGDGRVYNMILSFDLNSRGIPTACRLTREDALTYVEPITESDDFWACSFNYITSQGRSNHSAQVAFSFQAQVHKGGRGKRHIGPVVD